MKATDIATAVAPALTHETLVAAHADAGRVLAAALAPHHDTIVRCDDEIGRLNERIDECRRVRAVALHESAQLRHAHDVAGAVRERQILAAADPRIDTFVADLDRRIAQLMRSELVEREGVVYDVHSNASVSLHESNWEAVQLVARAMREAQRAARALKLEHVPDVAAALALIADRIPTVAAVDTRLRAEAARS